MARLVACTVAAASELALARVVAASLREHHPEAELAVLLADEVDGRFDPAAEPFRVLTTDDLGDPAVARMRLRYGRMELTYALVPAFLRALLREGAERVLYVKQESLVTARLDSALDALEDAALVLVPHLLATPPDHARERDVLLAGVYNLGFLGVAGRPEAHAFLDWWADRCADGCRHDVAGGMHYEQRWADLAPSLFAGVHVLRDPGVGVGHWNLPERDLRVHDDGRVTACGRPCSLVRFSGHDVERPDVVTRYVDRGDVGALGDAARLFARYDAAVRAAGHEECREWSWAYDRFADGTPVPPAVRALYAGVPEPERFGDPLRSQRLLVWLREPVAPGVARVWDLIAAGRPDVAAAYPDRRGADREGFRTWIATTGRREHGIPQVLA